MIVLVIEGQPVPSLRALSLCYMFERGQRIGQETGIDSARINRRGARSLFQYYSRTAGLYKITMNHSRGKNKRSTVALMKPY